MRVLLSFILVTTLYFSASADTLTLTMDTIVGVEDGQVEISVTADGFDSLAVFEGTLQWDTLSLEFVEVRDFGIDNLRSENFGEPSGTIDRLTWSWTEASADGESAPDGTVLFKILFNVTGSAGDNALVNFADTPLDVSASDNDLDPVVVIENDGLVQILTPLAVTADVVDVTCFGGNDGSITLNASGANGEYSYSWSNGSDSSAITDLIVGSYSFTITDDVNGQEITNSLSVFSPQEIVITLQDLTAEDDTLGTISIDVSGGTAPYSYTWTPDIMLDQGLENGVYTVLVTDDNNCTATDSIEIDIELSSSLSELQEKAVSAFPNPTLDKVYVEIDALDRVQSWDLFSAIGSKINSGIIKRNQDRFIINLEGQTPGTYFLKLEDRTISILLIE